MFYELNPFAVQCLADFRDALDRIIKNKGFAWGEDQNLNHALGVCQAAGLLEVDARGTLRFDPKTQPLAFGAPLDETPPPDQAHSPRWADGTKVRLVRSWKKLGEGVVLAVGGIWSGPVPNGHVVVVDPDYLGTGMCVPIDHLESVNPETGNP